ncbi:hypothetical protein GGQ85_004105 [Nitrobacter vulgaris]|uniref:hypothetical protein n=1 Tax=Nitrobacter vulgaris TaxID=29421 RepID=UPI00285D6230|nr:hypothetical protein [Nitrobacter vulgaris]MDR6306374.1 hypothetical protein [Nitrobacter vulgaris]
MFSLLSKAVMCIVALITATATGYVYYHGGMADTFQGGSPQAWKHGGVHGAPGPLMGAAGLPLLAAYGVYRLVSRRRKKLAE